MVKVFDFGDAAGSPYLAMEYLPGGTLAEKLKASGGCKPPGSTSSQNQNKNQNRGADTPRSPFNPKQAAELLRKLALAVQAAHDCQIVHRDLKPSNIMFDSAGEPRVTDFGLAKKAGGGDLTATNAIMGTAAYMAPEQAKGESKFVGPQADVWALGVILYECLTGARPFTGSHDLEIIRNVIDHQPSSIRSHVAALPKDLELIVEKCLAKDPTGRYASAAALAEDLRRWQHGEPVSVKAAGMLERITKWTKRNKLAAGIVAGSLLGVILTTSLAIWAVGESRRADAAVIKANDKTQEAENEVKAAIAANAELLAVADERQFALSFPKIAEKSELAIPPLLAIIETKIADDAKDEDKERLVKQQANAAVALVRMNAVEKVWPLLKHQPDPRLRSYLIHRLAPLGADPKAIVDRLALEPEVSIRRALLLSLGEFTEAQLPLVQRNALLPQLQEIYRNDPDAGLHAAAEWLLRTWKQEAWLKKVNDDWAQKASGGRQPPVESANDSPRPRGVDTPRSPSWHVNSQGQTMILIPGPVEFLMGSPKTEADRFGGDEEQHLMKINRSFAIAANPVMLEQYRKFAAKHEASTISTDSVECPVVNVTWHNAAAYCNWLSEQEGIPKNQWCYELNEKGEVAKLKPKYLSLSGYRLPSEAEWEYAARAGSRTSRYFGETAELLPKYAWFERNSNGKAQPVGLLKPNDFGCFDMLGNIWQWNLNIYQTKPQSEDSEDELVVKGIDRRALRGGTFYDAASVCRASNRNYSEPAYRYDYFGFRPARTLIP